MDLQMLSYNAWGRSIRKSQTGGKYRSGGRRLKKERGCINTALNFSEDSIVDINAHDKAQNAVYKNSLFFP